MPSPGRSIAARRSSSTGSPKCRKRPPLQVPMAVCPGSLIGETVASALGGGSGSGLGCRALVGDDPVGPDLDPDALLAPRLGVEVGLAQNRLQHAPAVAERVEVALTRDPVSLVARHLGDPHARLG